MSSDEISRIREKKFRRARRAIKDDNVDALKDVLDVLPEFNTMVDRDGWNLLTLSCIFKSKEVFDYLLNLNCFNLEAVDRSGLTTLMKVFFSTSDYFGVKLIDAGADVHKLHKFNKESYLHLAIHKNLLKSAELLLQKGVDPNVQDSDGKTSLHCLFSSYYTSRVFEVFEALDLLLRYGADTAVSDNLGNLPFDYAIIHGGKSSSVTSIQEHLLYCTLDSYSDYRMPSGVFTKFLIDASHCANILPLFNNVMDIVSEVFFHPGRFPFSLFTVSPDLLKIIIERYGCVIAGILSGMKPYGKMTMNIDNVEILLNSVLHFATVEFISKLELQRIYLDNRIISKDEVSEEEVSSLIFYLLSYGLNVTSYDCEYIYQFQGYSELFKTMLLLLDYPDTSRIDCPMTEIILDIHSDLNTVLARFNRRFRYKIEPLLNYFANPELRLFCESLGNKLHRNIINKLEQLPRVPSLLQLARDETRRHIVRRYNLQKTSQYYWVLRRRFSDTVYEKILSFEAELYE